MNPNAWCMPLVFSTMLLSIRCLSCSSIVCNHRAASAHRKSEILVGFFQERRSTLETTPYMQQSSSFKLTTKILWFIIGFDGHVGLENGKLWSIVWLVHLFAYHDPHHTSSVIVWQTNHPQQCADASAYPSEAAVATKNKLWASAIRIGCFQRSCKIR